MENKNTTQEKIVDDKKISEKSNIKFVWITAIVILVSALLFLLYYAANSPTFTWTKVVAWAFFLVLFIGSIAGGYHLWTKKFDKKEDISKHIEQLPSPISTHVAEQHAREYLKELHYDYIDDPKINGSGQFGISKTSSIFTLAGRGYYENVFYLILINQNFPEKRFIAIVNNERDSKITKYQNLLAFDPESEPDIEELVRDNPLLGTQERIRRLIRSKKEVVEKKPEELL